MKIILLQCNWSLHNPIFPELGSGKPYQPIELCYIGAELQAKHQVKILDAFSENLTYSQVAEQIAVDQADAVVINSANTYLFWRCCYPDLEIVKKTIKAIRKKSNPFVVLIGPHGTVEPNWAKKICRADVVVRGEPEFAIAQLFSDISQPLFEKRGIQPMAVINDLSLLPVPAYELLGNNRYHCHYWLGDEKLLYKRGILLEYSRGCPYQCGFCFRRNFREKYRAKPAARIIEEIQRIRNYYHCDYIFFIDEIFNVDTDNFRQFLNQLKTIDIPFGCQCRPDLMTREIVDLLSESGCVYIEYGLESLNAHNRNKLNKNMQLLKTMRMINYTKTKIDHVVYNLLDFSTYSFMLDNGTVNCNENVDTLLAITNENEALETIVLYPQTDFALQAAKALGLREFGFEQTIRLYWLSCLLKLEFNWGKCAVRILQTLCLHMSFSWLKALMICITKKKQLPITYARRKQMNR